MKNKIKKIIQRIFNFIYNKYIENIYIIQMKYKLLSKTDYIDSEYKNKIIEYWKIFGLKIRLDWHKFYSKRNGIEDEKYIPEDIFYSKIEPFYNKSEFKEAYSDKSFHNIWFPELNRPFTIAKNIGGNYYDDQLNIMEYDQVLNICECKSQIIIKTSLDSGGGRDICFIENNYDNKMKSKVMETMKQFGENYVIQEVIEQHKILKSINPQSVNTIRIISLLKDGNVYILSSVLRMGINGAKVDNQAAGGISCGIREDGKLSKYAFDKKGNKLTNHPQGFVFENQKVPSYNEVLEIVKKIHIRLGHFKIISWDFAIDKDGNPIFIEHNLKFQEINFHQLNNGPLFGKFTNEIIEQVFGKK